MSNLQRAIEIAVKAHQNQIQKNGLPYVLHPLKLMFNVESITAKIVAVLHDVIEDSTDWTIKKLRVEGFTEEILTALDCLTHRKNESYADYIERISTNSIAIEVKLADLKDNIDSTRIYQNLSDKDFKRLLKYHHNYKKILDIKKVHNL